MLLGCLAGIFAGGGYFFSVSFKDILPAAYSACYWDARAGFKAYRIPKGKLVKAHRCKVPYYSIIIGQVVITKYYILIDSLYVD